MNLIGVDDRRRFRELWKELVFARLLAASVAGVLGFWGGVYVSALFGSDWAPLLVLGVFLALPSAVATRGRLVGLAILAAVLGGLLTPILVTEMGMMRSDFLAEFATLCGALGVSEGLVRRSVATTHCGLLGGISAGALGGVIFHEWTWSEMNLCPPSPLSMTAAFAVLFLTFHISIGLSLALGGWIRDWPKRKAAPEGGHE